MSKPWAARAWPRALLAAVLALAPGVACSGTDGASDADAATDAGAATEAGPDADAGPHPDTGLAADAGPEPCSELDSRPVPPEVFIGPTGLAHQLAEWIGSSQRSLRLSMYQLSAEPMIRALEAAAQRGVDVQVVLDRQQRINDPARTRIEAAGGAVVDGPGAFEHYHAKFLLVDDEMAVVTSSNMNDYSLERERNHGVILRDEHDLDDLDLLFAYDWNQAFSPVDLSCTRLVIGPDNSRERLARLLESAESTLLIQHLSFTDEDMRELVAERVAAGVSVRVILADPEWIESNLESASALRSAGAEVRFLIYPDNHTKLIVADGARAYVGSTNLSWTSLTRNRELGVVLTHPDTVDGIETGFDRDWERSQR